MAKKSNNLELEERVKTLEDLYEKNKNNFGSVKPVCIEPKPATISNSKLIPDNITFCPLEDTYATTLRLTPLPKQFEMIKSVNDKFIETTLDELYNDGFGATVYDDKFICPHSYNPDTAGIMVGVATDGLHATISTIMNTSNMGFRHVHCEKYMNYCLENDQPIESIAIIDDGPVTTPVFVGGIKQKEPSAILVPLNNLPAMGCAVSMLTKLIVDEAADAIEDDITSYDEIIF